MRLLRSRCRSGFFIHEVQCLQERSSASIEVSALKTAETRMATITPPPHVQYGSNHETAVWPPPLRYARTASLRSGGRSMTERLERLDQLKGAARYSPQCRRA
jgi:hypothetical protein